MLQHHGEDVEGKRCVISGAGNVSQYTARKLIELGGKVVTLSDRSGFIYLPEGITEELIEAVIDLKSGRRQELEVLAAERGIEFHSGERPWNVPCDMAFPCATQNELDGDDARALLANGCDLVSEGANMPSTLEAAHAFEQAGILYAPGKAANAGGVAISGLEMTQNALRLAWTREEVDERLQGIMARIHEQCVEYGKVNGRINYVLGANVAGFVKVADAMLAYGVM
jgi:glutamate dehydrogenase (NADP+)